MFRNLMLCSFFNCVQVNDKKTESIRSFNKALMDDERVTISMVCLMSYKNKMQHLTCFILR